MELSIIISTHARAVSLARLLKSLAPQLHAAEHELIIADNGSPEPSILPSAHPPLLHLHDATPGKTRAQNRAIRDATGEIIAFLDDDVSVAPGYVDAVLAFFGSHPEFSVMKGRILAAEDPEAKAGSNAVYLDLPLVDHGDCVVEVRGVVGANMAFRREVFDRVGLLDERLGPGASGYDEESEISARLRRAGVRIGYAPAAVVYHEVDPERADRQRFLRAARLRGRSRALHEDPSRWKVLARIAVAWVRLQAAHHTGAAAGRIAREEQRLWIALGMRDTLSGRGW